MNSFLLHYLVNLVELNSFLHNVYTLQRECEEFKVRINALVAKAQKRLEEVSILGCFILIQMC